MIVTAPPFEGHLLEVNGSKVECGGWKFDSPLASPIYPGDTLEIGDQKITVTGITEEGLFVKQYKPPK